MFCHKLWDFPLLHFKSSTCSGVNYWYSNLLLLSNTYEMPDNQKIYIYLLVLCDQIRSEILNTCWTKLLSALVTDFQNNFLVCHNEDGLWEKSLRNCQTVLPLQIIYIIIVFVMVAFPRFPHHFV